MVLLKKSRGDRGQKGGERGPSQNLKAHKIIDKENKTIKICWTSRRSVAESVPTLDRMERQTDKQLDHIRGQNKQGGQMFTGCLWRSQMGYFLIWQPPVKQLPRQVSGRTGSTDNLMPAPTVFHKAQLMCGEKKKKTMTQQTKPSVPVTVQCRSGKK